MPADRPLKRRFGAFPLTFALALGCIAAPHGLAADSPVAPAFDPVAFFSGSTQGVGQLKKMLSAPHRTVTHGRGLVRADGMLVLDHRVEVQGEPVRLRQWQLRQTAPGQFGGSMSEASGPVSGTLAGNRLTMRYTMRGGMRVEQVVTMQTGGQSASNVMKISKFGMTVATLTETIQRI